MMHIHFDSSHVRRDRPADRLVIRIAREDAESGQTVADQVVFSTSAGFHVHNDLVAAALMTLAGHSYSSASFNFPVSEFCAETLRRYYELAEFGPVDPALEPRQRGRFLGLNFSGGHDSTAVLLLLRHIGEPVKVITTDY